MTTRTTCKFTKHFQLLLLVSLCVLKQANAGLLDPPVITLSLIDCEKAYMVQIFEDGRVEYRGGFGVKTRGWRNAQINPHDVAALSKKFKESVNSKFLIENREDLPGMAIREHGLTVLELNQDEIKRTFESGGKHGSPLFGGIMSIDKLRRNQNKSLNVTFALLQLEIIRITKLQQWVSDPTQNFCREGTNIRFKNLKAAK